jgi:hypothetical protein
MNEAMFKEKYDKFNLSDEDLNNCILTILNAEKYINKEIDDFQIKDIQEFVEHLIETNENKYNNFIHIARYFYYIDKKPEYIHMTKYFNTVGVLENIIERIDLFDSSNIKEEFLKDITLPPLGTESSSLPSYTIDFVKKLNKYFPQSKCNKILAGNNHSIPKESFMKEKEYYDSSQSLKMYLEDRHDRKVKELEHYYKNNLIWFEQIISQEVIEFVRNNKEVLSGVIENEKLYITKIPYDINNFLDSNDEKQKRYYACHCSFVREGILQGHKDIPKEWCYCSAGFAKYPFEVILEQELDITLLQTPIDGDLLCRFEIDLRNVEYKK